MTTREANRLILGSLVVAAVVTGMRRIQSGELPHPRIIVGALIAGAVLAMVAEFAPAPAGYLALIIVIGALLTSPETLNAIAGG